MGLLLLLLLLLLLPVKDDEETIFMYVLWGMDEKKTQPFVLVLRNEPQKESP